MDHTDHTLGTHGKDMHLFPCLQDRELGCGHETTGDEAELAVRIALLGLGRQNPYNKFLQQRDETDEDTGIEDVKRRMESSEDRIQLIRRDIGRCTGHEIHAPQIAHFADEKTEDTEYPDHAEEVEDKVRQGGTSGLHRRGERYNIRGDGRTDILTQDEGYTHINRQHMGRTEGHGDGHDRRRGLHGKREYTADEQVQEIRTVAPTGRSDKEITNRLHLIEVHLGGVDLERSKTQEQEAQTHEKITEVGIFLGVDKRDGHHDRRIDDEAKVERSATKHHNPCGESCTDVSTHDDGDSLRQGENARGYETDGHDGGCSRRLHGSRDEGTGEHPREAIGSSRTEDITERTTGHLLQAFGHHFQSVHQHRDGTDKRDNL